MDITAELIGYLNGRGDIAARAYPEHPGDEPEPLIVCAHLSGPTPEPGVETGRLQSLCAASSLKSKYRRLLKSELMHSCSFATVTRGEDGRPKVCAYPATAASAVWDQPEDRIRASMVVVGEEAQGRGHGPHGRRHARVPALRGVRRVLHRPAEVPAGS